MIRRVAVVMGGTESEHEISVRSGREVLEHLPPDRYETLAVTWRTDGRFEIPSGSEPVEAAAALAALREVDVAFLALHGPGGEDGRIQGFLETAGIAYTGSGVLGSALAMDKLLTKDVARRCGLETPPHATDIGADGSPVGFPCIVKPAAAGSSDDLLVADDREDLVEAFGAVSGRWSSVMIESLIEGPEVTGAVVENPETGEPEVLPLVEIRHEGHRVFDYEAKYRPGEAEEICPAPLDEVVADRVRRASLTMHEALGCRGVSRSDFILRDGVPVFLETNTIPGLTRESLLPRAARAAGRTMADLLDGLVRCALRAREVS